MLKDIIDRIHCTIEEKYPDDKIGQMGMKITATQTAQIVAREVLRKVREGVPVIQELPSSLEDPAGFMRNTGTNNCRLAVVTHLQSLEESLLDK